MIAILDDVLSESERQNILSHYESNNRSKNFEWFDKEINDNINESHFISKFLKIAHRYIDLSNMIGFETWSHYNTNPGWHLDKNETVYHSTGKIEFPLCSIVYYLSIENLIGGNFLTESETIKPKNNRLLIFSPGIYHSVESFIGTRLVIAISPWDHKV